MSSPNSIEEGYSFKLNISNNNSKSHFFKEIDFDMDNDDNDYEDLRHSIMGSRRYSERTIKSKIQQINLNNSPLLRLPTEILLQIFHHLERCDLYSLLTVCLVFADLIIEILWFRPNMQSESLFNRIKKIVEMPKDNTNWDYRLFIKRLNLSFKTKIVDDNLLSLFNGCPKLERLTLVNCLKLTHELISNVLVHCEKLQSIDLTGVTDIQDDIFYSLAVNCPRLQGLYAPGCGNVSEDAIVHLLKSCPMLKRLKFNNSNSIGDRTIQVMYENCKSLVEIDLHNCPLVTDKYLRYVFLELSQLREFRISNAAGITDQLFDLIPSDVYLEKLRIIDITGCNAITDRLVERLVMCAPRLRNIVLSKCMQISDASLRALSQLGRSLHYVHLGHCSSITDFGVASLVRSCHRIQYIDLACCSQLTDWTLVELANLPKLRRIGLVKCSLISDNGILEFVRRRGEQDCLERVHLSYCTNLTIGPIFVLLKNCPKLTHLSLTGITAFLRAEITQYCRDPPPDFNEQQKNLFCVFSGNGVHQLRNHLTHVMEDTSYQLDYGEMHALYLERRRMFMDGGEDMDQDEISLWARQSNLGLLQNPAFLNPEMLEINRQIFRELNEGRMSPAELREHFLRIIRERQQQQVDNQLQQQQRQQLENLQHEQLHTQQVDQLEQPNIYYAPQIYQPPVFPNTILPSLNETEDTDMDNA